LDGLDGGLPSHRKKRDRNKKRGRKNQYYTQIDAEDDQEAENMEMESLIGADNVGADHGGKNFVPSPSNKLGVIREVEDDNEQMPRKSLQDTGGSAKKKQVKITEDKEQIEKQMKKIEEEASNNKKSQELAKKMEEEATKLEDEIV
jgi:hypothetical protein